MSARTQPPRLGVTTSGKVDEVLVARAQAGAAQWGLPFFERRRKAALSPMLGDKADALLVFERQRLSLWDGQGALRFTPGMAKLRVKRLDAGVDEDILVRLAELSPGDHVLDCTIGLAGDALVSARAVGPTGRVVGLEKSLAMYALVSEGLATLDCGPSSCRIEVQHRDAGEFLRAHPDRSFDVVLFDPMFERPRRSSPAFDMLRRFADYTPLTAEVIEEARRVSRRCVLVKGSRYSDDLKKLGLTAEQGSRSATVTWARVRV